MGKTEETATIPLVEERLNASKRQVETGRVRIRTETVQDPVWLRDDLREDRVEVERVPCEREVARMPEVRTEGDLLIIPVVEERLITQKHLFLIEEVHVRRVSRIQPIEEPVMLRRQHVAVERMETSGEKHEE